MNHLKYLLLPFASIIIIIAAAIPASAEYVFTKDGSIIKCRITRDDQSGITVKNEQNATINIKRDNVIRVLYTELYMGKIFVRLTSREVIEGYQVDEDRDNYVFRKDITKPEEFTVPRKKVMFIARTNPTDMKGVPATESVFLSWSPPFKPAKSYKIYIRDIKNNEASFKNIGSTGSTDFNIKNLTKSWSYEIYATAISDIGEESLPSEKITVNTLPEPPEKLVWLFPDCWES